jgi:hypothetical protein
LARGGHRQWPLSINQDALPVWSLFLTMSVERQTQRQPRPGIDGVHPPLLALVEALARYQAAMDYAARSQAATPAQADPEG